MDSPDATPSSSSAPTTPSSPPPPTSTSAEAAAAPQPPQSQPQPQPQPSQPQSPQLATTAPETPSAAPSLPSPQHQILHTRPQQFHPPSHPPPPPPPQQQQQRPPPPRPRPPYSAFASPPSAISTTPTSGPMARGGMALGVPAQRRPQQQQQQGAPLVPFPSFGPNPSFGQPFSGINHPRGSEQSAAASTAQVRTPIQGTQTIGMVGSLTNAPSMRSSGLPAHHQTRPGQMQLRSTSLASTQPTGPQKLPGQGLPRASSTASLGSQSTVQPQSSQPLQQPWMSAQGKPSHGSSMPPPTYRPQVRPHHLLQRPSLPQHASHIHKQQLQSQQQQQQLQQKQQQAQIVTKSPQAATQQQLPTRAPGSANQKAVLPSSTQPVTAQGDASLADAADSGDHILSKRSIHELVAQVDPSEKLDPEVEDILMEIADDFVESITTVACSLAKHRKSTVLEAKDILLHLERNWNLTLPGFGGDEIKYYKKPLTNEIHKDRLAAIKKSMIVTPETGNAKNSTPGQAAPNTKSHQVKVSTAIGSPKLS